MNEHAQPVTLSERADALEEQMMHELGERIATKSTLFNIADGKVEMPNGPALKAANPDDGQAFDAARLHQTHDFSHRRVFGDGDGIRCHHLG